MASMFTQLCYDTMKGRLTVKKILSLVVLSAFLMASIIGCSGSATTGGGTQKTTTTTTTTDKTKTTDDMNKKTDD